VIRIKIEILSEHEDDSGRPAEIDDFTTIEGCSFDQTYEAVAERICQLSRYAMAAFYGYDCPEYWEQQENKNGAV
jgi:hypothetical protein